MNIDYTRGLIVLVVFIVAYVLLKLWETRTVKDYHLVEVTLSDMRTSRLSSAVDNSSSTSKSSSLADEPEWIVNDLGELGVIVNRRAYFLYKGYSLEYGDDDKHADGSPRLYRPVGKVEFGEVCRPSAFYTDPNAVNNKHRYILTGTFIEGLSDGKPEDYEWKPLSSITQKENHD